MRYKCDFPQERKALEQLIQKIEKAEECIWEAFDTDFFSDAKSFTYEVENFISRTENISPEVKQELLPLAEEGSIAIRSRLDSTGARTHRASVCMTKLSRKVNYILRLESCE